MPSHFFVGRWEKNFQNVIHITSHHNQGVVSCQPRCWLHLMKVTLVLRYNDNEDLHIECVLDLPLWLICDHDVLYTMNSLSLQLRKDATVMDIFYCEGLVGSVEGLSDVDAIKSYRFMVCGPSRDL